MWSGFTLDWYKELFQKPMILDALWVTLAVSHSGCSDLHHHGHGGRHRLHQLPPPQPHGGHHHQQHPLTNADIITGVSMMLFFVLAVNVFNGTLGAALGIKWNLGFVTLLIAHLTFDIPHVILCVMPKLQQLDPNIYEAAQDLGAPGFLAFRKVILPEIMPGVINGLLIAFTMSIDDFRDQLLHRRLHLLHPVHGHLFHGQKRVSPEINALSTPALRGGGRPAGHRQCPQANGQPAGQAAAWFMGDVRLSKAARLDIILLFSERANERN